MKIWEPSADRIAAANLTRFLERTGHDDFVSLWRWSIEDREAFWPAVRDFTGIVASDRGNDVLVDGDRMPGAKWFPGARLNFAENLLRHDDGRTAIIARNERGERREWSHAELRAEVAAMARALRDAGVGSGDRVAGFVPNVPEAVVAMLAAASVGAIWSSCSPDFGVRGVLDRFGQIEPKVLVAADGYAYAGKEVDVRERLARVVDALPSVERVVMFPNRGRPLDLSGIRAAVAWRDFAGEPGGAIDFDPLPFDHPLYVLYSSGTTGVPKAIVHGAGGTLLQHAKEHVLHTDVRADDRVFYFTTCGWMMWNWLVSALHTGAAICVWDGSPIDPRPDVLWEWAAADGITIFGTSAKYLASIEKAGVRPAELDLSSLRAVLSTGSPLSPESFAYVYRDVKKDVHLASISGGTDIVSCFVLGNPTAPVYAGEIQAPGLGMSVEVLDAAGRPAVGEKGELCCTKAFPSMPLGFWNDPDGERYRRAYFERYPGVWCHGDWAERTRHGGFVIHGRSDATLNPGGVRIGTAEIYRVVEALPEIAESIAVGQEHEGDTRIVLFVVLQPGASLDDELDRQIRAAIRSEASPRHVPAVIRAVPEIPRTRSGKIVELAVTDVLHGRPVANVDALANPEALDHFRQP